MSGRPLDVSDTATVPPEVSAAIIRDFALSVRPMAGFVLTLTVFGSMLIPILIILLYLSNPALRRKPIFILNVLSIIIGIALAIWGVYVELTAVIAPWKKVPIINNTIFAVFLLFAPWLSELVLLLRLVAVYPPSTTPQAKLALTFAFPIICKTIRFVCLILWLQYYAEQCGSHNVGNAFAAAKATDYKSKPWMQIEWFLQMADNTYVSTLFIVKLVRSNAWKEDIDRRMSLCGDSSFSAQLKQLLCIAIYNFVIPVILNVAILIELYTDPNYHVNTTYLLFVNFYVSIIAVVFATIWSSSYSFRSRQGTTKSGKDTELNWRVSTPSMSLEICNASPVTAEQCLISSEIKGKEADWDVEYHDGAHVSTETPPRSTMHADRREHRETV